MIGVIIQARMGSTRLPNKTMHKILGKPLLAYSVERVAKAKYVDKVIVATTMNNQDDKIVSWCKENNILCFRGDEEDVLDRYYQAAKANKLDIILRVTSDCPFIDFSIVDMLITTLINFRCDYVSNRWKTRSWPHGLDVEVFNMNTLEEAWKQAKSPLEREHVTPYILNNSEKFDLMEIPLNKDRSTIRLTVDYKEDMEFVEKVMPQMINNYGEDFTWIELIDLLTNEPKLLEINKEKNNTKLY